MEEKRGPIEKGPKGWPINPFGVVALIIFGLIIALLIIRPLFGRKTQIIDQNQNANAQGGSLISPQAGEITRSANITIQIAIDEPQKVAKVQFWAKTYADGKWQMIGEVTSAPFSLNWQIPEEFKNKSIALTSHIYQKGGNVIKDPGGWREGIIILSP
ncbi:Ig-like domain-containing protein [Candidatus Curtissbacteria bacterium]|nr:Ig-like domain-containing protein [Candidatus Curtissbacteria bacterium]